MDDNIEPGESYITGEPTYFGDEKTRLAIVLYFGDGMAHLSDSNTTLASTKVSLNHLDNHQALGLGKPLV